MIHMTLASIYRQILIETKSSIWHSCRGHGVVKGNYQHQILTMRGVVVSLACLLVVCFVLFVYYCCCCCFFLFLGGFSVGFFSCTLILDTGCNNLILDHLHCKIHFSLFSIEGSHRSGRKDIFYL